MFDILGRPRGGAALAGAAAAITIAAAFAPACAEEQARRFDIPAQPLASALIEFSRQADVMVIADPVDLDGRRSPAVVGEFTPSAALRDRAGQEVQSDASMNWAEEREDAGQTVPRDETRRPDEIVVTGTRIRGASPTVPVHTVTRAPHGA